MTVTVDKRWILGVVGLAAACSLNPHGEDPLYSPPNIPDMVPETPNEMSVMIPGSRPPVSSGSFKPEGTSAPPTGVTSGAAAAPSVTDSGTQATGPGGMDASGIPVAADAAAPPPAATSGAGTPSSSANGSPSASGEPGGFEDASVSPSDAGVLPADAGVAIEDAAIHDAGDGAVDAALSDASEGTP